MFKNTAKRKKGRKDRCRKESSYRIYDGWRKEKSSRQSRKKRKTKKLKTVEEVKADIDKRNPTYVSPVTGGLLPGTGPKEEKEKKIR